MMELKEKIMLYFIGAGDALERAKQLAAEHSITFLHHPAVRNEELPEHLATMDMLVLPSRTTHVWIEQFGHILLEAMALQVPVIGSSSGEIPNVIGEAGLIFQEGDAAQLAASLDRLCGNENERSHFATLGRKRVEGHFTNEIIARRQMEIYEWMLREEQPVGATKYTTIS